MNIGFIGLGIMGQPMCMNLLRADYNVYIHSSKEETNQTLKQHNANIVESHTEIVKNIDILCLMLPNSQDVYDVLIASDLYKSLKPKSIVVDMSSITPKMSQQVSNIIGTLGHHYIDAPVSGGEEKAIDGTLAFMCGGEEQVFNQVKPLLEIMGSSITHIGDVGSGNATKLVNQIIVANNIISLSEGMAAAKALGLDQSKVYNAISSGLAGSAVMDNKTHRIIDEDYEPGFKLNLHMKDLNNVFETLDDNDLDLPATLKTKEIMGNLLEKGFGEKDHSALYKYYENQ